MPYPIGKLVTPVGVRSSDGSLHSLSLQDDDSLDVTIKNLPAFSSLGCRVYNNATLTVLNATLTAVPFAASRYDPSGMHSNTVNNSRITIATVGTYLFGANISFVANATGYREMRISLNGSVDYKASVVIPQSAVAAVMDLNLSCLWQCNIGDFMQVIIFQNTGASMTIPASTGYQQEFWAQQVG